MFPCWAPRRVESTGVEIFSLSSWLLQNQKSKRLNRHQTNNCLDVNVNSTLMIHQNLSITVRPRLLPLLPCFLVITSREDRQVSSLSPFVIEKVLHGIAGVPNSIKKPRDFFPPCRGPGAQFPLGTSLN